MKNFAGRLLQAGRDEAVALVSEGRRLTYADLRREVLGRVGALQQLGLERGDRVALLAENGSEFVAAYLAIMAAGMCAVPLPAGQDRSVWQALLELVEPEAIMACNHWREQAEMLGPVLVGEGDLRGDVVEVHGNDLAALMFTSGSTGTPRPVKITHQNLEANTRDIVDFLALNSGDRCLVVLPFSYCYGASLLHTHLWVGARLVSANIRRYEQALDTLIEEECTGMAGVPSTYQILLRFSTFLDRDLPSLRWLQQAGGRLSESAVLALHRGLPRVRLYLMYGQTEATARLSILAPELVASKPGSVGQGLRSTRLRLARVDQSGTGEIVASGPAVSPGYWGSPEATGQRFRDGELYTGDLARADVDGDLYLVGRRRSFIKSAGYRISPHRVERLLEAHAGVDEAAVVGLPDEVLGEAVVAFVVGSASVKEILAHCRGELPPAQVPSRVHKLDKLPRTDRGKLLRERLLNWPEL